MKYYKLEGIEIVSKMPYNVILSSSQFGYDGVQINDWLLSNIGEEEKDWQWYYLKPCHTWQFDFNTEEDKIKFILRWL